MSPNSEAARRYALRVGILHGDRLVEERVVSAGHVSVGSTAADTFIVPPTAELGRSRTLFSRTGAGYALRLDAAMEGKLAAGRRQPVRTLADVAASSRAPGTVLLDEGARGSLRFGEVCVLFQAVGLHEAARPRLPPSLKGRLAGNLDWAMLAIAAVSLFGHVGFVAWLSRLDYPRRPSIEDIPERWPVYHLTTQPINVKVAEAAQLKQDPNVDRPTVGPHVVPRPHSSAGPRRALSEAELRDQAAERNRRMTDRVRNAVAQIITTRADGSNVVSDLLAAGSPSERSENVFARVGTRIGTTGRPALGPRDSSGGPASRGGVGIRTGGIAEERPIVKKEERPIKVPEPTTGPVTLDPGCDAEKVALSIRERKSAFTACYSKVLPHDPSLSGKVVLMLDIAASGRIRHAEVRDETLHSDALDSCIEAAASHWIFPDLGCGETHVEFPLFFTPPRL